MAFDRNTLITTTLPGGETLTGYALTATVILDRRVLLELMTEAGGGSGPLTADTILVTADSSILTADMTEY